MSQASDYTIDNSTGANVRSDINTVLGAIATNNSGGSDNGSIQALGFFANTSSSQLQLKNAAGNAFINLRGFDGTLPLPDGSESSLAAFFDDDTNTGFYSSAADKINFVTGGTERLELGATTIFNESGADVDFRVEGDGRTHMIFVDAGNDRVGLGCSSPDSEVVVQGSAHSNLQVWAGNASTKGFLQTSQDSDVRIGTTTSHPLVFYVAGNIAAQFDTSRRLLLGKTSGSFQLDIGAGSSSLVRLTNTLESSNGSHDANLVAGGTYYQNLTLQQRSFKVQTFNDSSVVNGFTLTPNQKALFGTYFSETTSGGATCQLQVQGTDHNTSGILAARFAADDGGPRLSFLKSRSSSGGGVDKLLENDTCGSIFWVAANNNDVNNGFMACISVEADATQGGADTPGRMRFFTTPDGSSTLQERMRIDKDGNVLIGTTDTNLMTSGGDGDKGMVISQASGFQVKATSHHTAEFNRAGTTGGNVLFFQNGTEVGNIAVTASATSYNTSSDYRLKENVVAISDGITRLKTLKPSRFNFIVKKDLTQDGFLAHEVQSVVPEAISGEKDAVKEDGSIDPQVIDQSKLVPLLVAAVQELITKVETLEAA